MRRYFGWIYFFIYLLNLNFSGNLLNDLLLNVLINLWNYFNRFLSLFKPWQKEIISCLNFIFCSFGLLFSIIFQVFKQNWKLIFEFSWFSFLYTFLGIGRINYVNFLRMKKDVGTIIVSFNNLVLFDIFSFFEHTINDRERWMKEIFIFWNDINNCIRITERF